jgi:hypothetical protein
VIINVIGGNKSQKRIAKNSVIFSCYSLLSSKLFYNLECNIHICKPSDVLGSCIWEDTNIRPKEFTIELHKELHQREFITTACHESVHLKQFARGELRELYKGGHRVMWYDVDCSDFMYKDQPWEIEAKALEDTLYNMYTDYMLKEDNNCAL